MSTAPAKLDQPGLVVLSFHRVVDRPVEGHDVAWPTFFGLLDDMVAAGSRFRADLTPERLSGGEVVLTFDDGTADHARVAEELAVRGIHGIFFVSAGRVGATAMLNAEHVRRISSLGHVVGSHGIDHIPLDRLSPSGVTRELAGSKARLEAIVRRPVLHYAFAGGIFTTAALRLLPDTGYATGRTMRWGFYRDEDRRWTIPSLPVTELTLQRGWISSAIREHRIPVPMALVGYAKDIVPRDLRQNVRRAAQRVLAGRHS